MADPALEHFVRERDEKLSLITSVKNVALEQSRDLNADDMQSVRAWKERIRQLDEQIELLGDDLEMATDVRDRIRKLSPGGQVDVPLYRTAGEMLWDTVHGTMGSMHDVNDQEASKRWNRVMKRAAEHMGTTAAATTPTAGGFGGLMVQPMVGPVISIFPAGRPFLTAVGVQPAPNALSFTRPRIVDPDFKTGAGVQALQKAELVSKKFDIKTDPLSLVTVGGYLNVSQQLLSLAPGALDIILGQLQKRVAWQSEAAAITEMQLTTQNTAAPLAANATAAAVLAAVFEAAALVYDATNELPTWIAMGPLGWRRLGSLVDSANRPMFPFLGAANAMGSMAADSFGMVGPAGLTPIVTPGITTPNLYVGGSSSFEAYEYPFPVLEAVEPSLLGRQVAVATAMAFYRPTTVEEVGAVPGPAAPAEANGIVEIVWTP